MNNLAGSCHHFYSRRLYIVVNRLLIRNWEVLVKRRHERANRKNLAAQRFGTREKLPSRAVLK